MIKAKQKAAYERLRSIGPFVYIVNKRNVLAEQLGFIDYYDYQALGKAD
jgi:hypothetical protein